MENGSGIEGMEECASAGCSERSGPAADSRWIGFLWIEKVTTSRRVRRGSDRPGPRKQCVAWPWSSTHDTGAPQVRSQFGPRQSHVCP
jgi:hypothetical protein